MRRGARIRCVAASGPEMPGKPGRIARKRVNGGLLPGTDARTQQTTQDMPWDHCQIRVTHITLVGLNLAYVRTIKTSACVLQA
jgi:hypothetical protein